MSILELIKSEYNLTKIEDNEYTSFAKERARLEKDIFSLLDSKDIELFKKYIDLVDCIIMLQIDNALEFSFTRLKQIISEIYSVWYWIKSKIVSYPFFIL